MTPQPLRFAEFFAGIGLMRLGLEKTGWQCVFANDIDPAKYRMYRDQFGEEESFVLGDIGHLQPSQIPSIELATASFPCTDLSLAGARKGLKGQHSSAFWLFANLIERLGDRRPPIILLENVGGFVTSNGGQDLKVALEALNRLGYAVDAFMVDASSFVPQSRPRLFIISSMDGQSSPVVRLHSGSTSLDAFIAQNRHIQWLQRPLPSPPIRKNDLHDVFEHISASNPMWWSADRVQYLLSQMSESHRTLVDEAIKSKSTKVGTVFRRVRHGKTRAELRTDGVAGCLRTPKGGSAKQILLVMGSGSVCARLLTPRECARLMGADDYRIEVSDQQALFGFGDAVCVPVVEWIAKHYLNPLIDQMRSDNHASSLHREAI